jgi:AmmeMemoRadiSam system protein A
LPTAAQQRLLSIAREAIGHGLAFGSTLTVALDRVPKPLLARRGVFVTLTIEERLRGCVGNMAGDQALAQSVSDAAHNAAFRDYRFDPLARDELDRTRIEVSVLSPSEPLQATDRDDLLRQLVPGIDGLVLSDMAHRATFLPKVWEQLPSPETFLAHLLRKAGLPAEHWSDTLRFERYYTTSFGEPSGSMPG